MVLDEKKSFKSKKTAVHPSISEMMFSDQVDIAIKEYCQNIEKYIAPLTGNELLYQIVQNKTRLKDEIIGI